MPLPSKSSPITLVNSPLPSERNRTLPLPPAAFDQASITKGSFTATQATVYTTFFLKASALSDKSRKVLEMAGWREGAWHCTHHDLPVGKDVRRGQFLDALGPKRAEGGFGQAVSDTDR